MYAGEKFVIIICKRKTNKTEAFKGNKEKANILKGHKDVTFKKRRLNQGLKESR